MLALSSAKLNLKHLKNKKAMALRPLRCKNEECNSRNIKTNDPQQLIEYMRKPTVEVEGECLDCGHKFKYHSATKWGKSSGRIMY